MRIDVEADALIALIGEIARDTKDDARIKFPGTQADGVITGIALYHEALQAVFTDAEEFDLSRETADKLVGDAAGMFCTNHCTRSKDLDPGAHEDCQACPIMPFTVGAIEQAVDKALGLEQLPADPQFEHLDPTPDAPPPRFNADAVTAARARLDEQIKGGE
jgi:hypothetical protein